MGKLIKSMSGLVPDIIVAVVEIVIIIKRKAG